MTTAPVTRRRTVGAVLFLVLLPAALAVLEAATFHARNRHNGTIVSSGVEREYLLYVPRSHDRARPAPLVISIHGGAVWAAVQAEMSRWNRLADQHGFIVVYPSGAAGSGPRHWEMDAATGGAGLMRDVRFIADLIDTLTQLYDIDPARLYADGMSNGGGMAFALSCTLSDRIAAVGLMAAAHFLPWRWCTDQRAVPMIAFHGTADRLTPYHGGPSPVAGPGYRFPSIPAWTAQWARRNRCGPATVDSAVAPGVTRQAYTQCADGAAVELYTVAGGGHQWFGGTKMPEWGAGAYSNSVDATALMWAFFREHRLRDTITARAAIK